MQRNKGAPGERELAGILRDLTGWNVQRRVRQPDGDSDLAGVPGWALKVKRRKAAGRGEIGRRWLQTLAQATDALPALFYRLDRGTWRWRLAAGGMPHVAARDVLAGVRVGRRRHARGVGRGSPRGGQHGPDRARSQQRKGAHAVNRKSPGRWKPGESGNPKGRAVGSGEIGKLRASIAQHVPDIIDRLVQQAKDGDAAAARLLLERCLPPIKPTEQPAPMALPDGTLSEQGRALLAAAGTGALAPGQAAQLLAGLGSLAKLIETDELAARVAALEKQSEPKS